MAGYVRQAGAEGGGFFRAGLERAPVQLAVLQHRHEAVRVHREIVGGVGAAEDGCQQTGIAGDAFYSGANAGHSLIGALEQSGWEITFWNAHYHYGLSYQAGTERLRYVEGDVYTG